ncbi:MAG: hypothetical protein ABFD20_04595, partial [Anaerolineales bacterium]
HALWGVALLIILVAAALRWRRSEAPTARCAWAATAVLASLSLVALGCQLVGTGALSARVWAMSGSGLTVYLALAASRNRPGETTCGRRPLVVLQIAAHLVGLTLVIEQAPEHWPVVLLAAFLLVSASIGARPKRLCGEVLAPLYLLYAATWTQLAFRWLGVDLTPYAAATFPNPLSAWLHPEAPLVAAVGWCWLRAIGQSHGRWRTVLLLAVPFALASWYLATVARHLTTGVTGSDPYGYVQMAVDLVVHGSVQHQVPLAELATRLGLPTWPTVPVGYNPPVDGRAVAVWPPAWSALLAVADWLGGERAMLWLAPLAHLAAGVVGGLLGAELAQGYGRRARCVLGSLTGMLLLTSYEGVTRSLVPMADAAASLGAAAMFLLLAKALRRDQLGWSLAAGALWGASYALRHPQLALGFGGLCLLLVPDRGWGRRVAHLGLFGLGALILASPDLAFHAHALGSPWRTESGEWFLLSLRNVPANWHALWQDGWWRLNEWGYLWPVILAGVVVTLRSPRNRLAYLALLLGYGSGLLLNLCYGALRLRDLTPVFAWLAILAAQGAWALAEQARQRWPRHLRTLLAVALALSLGARSADTLRLPTQTRVWTFGAMTNDERVGLESLSALTPSNAVIATGLNAGAVQLYGHRETLRPASWTADECQRMLTALQQEQRPLYVLDDGQEMATWVAQGLVLLQQVAILDIPRLGLGGQHEAGPGILYCVAP